MELLTFLFICLSQAKLGSIWVHGLTDAAIRNSLDTGAQPTSNKNGQRRPSRNIMGPGVAVDTLPDNMTHMVADAQKYYRWRRTGPEDRRTEDLWVDLSTFKQSRVRVHGILSNSHRQAARVALSFNFPFYGHYLRQITIATGGFIFTGEITHRMLTATQYIAPLMANFDPSFSQNSTVMYMDNGNLFVVQWDKLQLQGREKEGPFTFQVALHSNGTVIFNYREVPLPIQQINSTEHPVKVGMSDAFMALLPSPHSSDSKRQTIYEYHRVEIDITKIISRSAFEFTPLPTCLQHTTCDLCVMSNLTTGCGWCNTIQRCSEGMDRHRQEWLDYNCPEQAKESICEDYSQGSPEGSTGLSNNSAPDPTSSSSAILADSSVTEDSQTVPPNFTGATENTAIIAGVVAALLLLVVLTLLAVYYISSHPTVAPPFYLMQRRTNNYWPSMKFRNQGCPSSYTEVELGGHEKEGFIEAEQCC